MNTICMEHQYLEINGVSFFLFFWGYVKYQYLLYLVQIEDKQSQIKTIKSYQDSSRKFLRGSVSNGSTAQYNPFHDFEYPHSCSPIRSIIDNGIAVDKTVIEKIKRNQMNIKKRYEIERIMNKLRSLNV